MEPASSDRNPVGGAVAKSMGPDRLRNERTFEEFPGARPAPKSATTWPVAESNPQDDGETPGVVPSASKVAGPGWGGPPLTVKVLRSPSCGSPRSPKPKTG